MDIWGSLLKNAGSVVTLGAAGAAVWAVVRPARERVRQGLASLRAADTLQSALDAHAAADALAFGEHGEALAGLAETLGKLDRKVDILATHVRWLVKEAGGPEGG